MDHETQYLPLSLSITDYYPTDRPYSIIEVILYLQHLYYYTTPTSYRQLAKLWDWTYHKVRRLFVDYNIKLNYRESNQNKRNKQGYICKNDLSVCSGFIFYNEHNITENNEKKGIISYKSTVTAKDPSILLEEGLDDKITEVRRNLILKLHNLGCTNAILGGLAFSLKEKELIFLLKRLKHWRKSVEQKGKEFQIGGAVNYIVKTEIEAEYSTEAIKIDNIVQKEKADSSVKILSFEKFSEVIKEALCQYPEFANLLTSLKKDYPEIGIVVERFPFIHQVSQHTTTHLKNIYTRKYLPLFKMDEQ